MKNKKILFENSNCCFETGPGGSYSVVTTVLSHDNKGPSVKSPTVHLPQGVNVLIRL